MKDMHREGVIKFDLDYREGPPVSADYLTELNAWRTIFCRLGLLGQDPARYGGLGFGNLSRRYPEISTDRSSRFSLHSWNRSISAGVQYMWTYGNGETRSYNIESVKGPRPTDSSHLYPQAQSECD